MSGNRRKKFSTRPAEADEEPMLARVVAIPKNPDPSAMKTDPKPKAKSDRIGDILRHARLERNDDLYLIAEYLCIKPAFLVALENSRYDEFPADAYVIGFLRTYATFLGVDGKEAVDRYRFEMAGRRKKPVLSMPIPLTEGRAPSSLIMVGATVAALLIYALWYGISSANRTSVNVPPPLPSAQQIAPAIEGSAAGLTAPLSVSQAPTPSTPASTSSSSSSTGSAVIPPAAPGIIVGGAIPAATTIVGVKGDAKAEALKEDKAVAEKEAAAETSDKDAKKQVYGDPNEAAHVIIRATQSSWISVTDASGKTVFDHVLKVGDTYKVPNKPGLLLTTGNGNGIDILVDGAATPKVATGAPHVVKNIPLDPSHLTTEPSAQ